MEGRWEKLSGKKVGLYMIYFVITATLLYVLYIIFAYRRIEDNTKLSIVSPQTEGEMVTGQEYTAVSYNIGFGAYTPEFTFFMDGGKSSVGESVESVRNCVQGAAETAEALKGDFLLFQEVDLDATRSHHLNQKELLDGSFSGYANQFAVGFDSPYLAVPPWEPHGKTLSGMATYSIFSMKEAVRYSLPVSKGVGKFLDMDRCYSVSKIPVENGKILCLYHVHLSAYGNNPAVREEQLSKLLKDMENEYTAGNYVLCGGDFNHDMIEGQKKGKEESWSHVFPRKALPDGFSIASDHLETAVVKRMAKSTRKADIPYQPEKSSLVTVDGFILSKNIEMVDFYVKDTAFQFSDHNPVVLKFRLKE